MFGWDEKSRTSVPRLSAECTNRCATPQCLAGVEGIEPSSLVLETIIIAVILNSYILYLVAAPGVEPGLWRYELQLVPDYTAMNGGTNENRTRNLLNANQVLSQLSYSPMSIKYWWKRRESNSPQSACKAVSPPWNIRPHLFGSDRGS